MSIKDSGPAFPVQSAEWQGHGISMRDYFAAKAMQGMNSNPYWDDKTYSFISEHAYKQADAMIAAREATS